jgi:hypothetical protein
LVSSAVDVKVVWDASTYSFIFQLTLPPGGLSLLDSFGLPLAETADTLATYLASTPELGTPIKTFCAKISFVYDAPPSAPYPTSLRKEYHGKIKETTTTAKANKEADIQRMLFEMFACRRSTASFVPDVLAHAILSRREFVTIFGKALKSNVASAKSGVVGTPNKILNWIAGWTFSEPVNVDVILMEMMDFERTAPGVPRTTEFGMIHSLRSLPHRHQHEQAALRMSAEIALVRGKGVMPHDFHEGNGLATEDGMQLYLIDWGGLFYLLSQADLDKVLDDFDRLCASAENGETEETKRAQSKVSSAKTDNEKKLARFPCLQDLCGFFQISFEADPATNVSNLRQQFKAHLTTLDDFTCSVPIPQTVHRALMMVAFVDFMSNRMNFNYPYCQCGSVLSIVYPDQSATRQSTTGILVSAFDDFRTFLKTFAVDAFPVHTRLQVVVQLITEIVKLCPTACSPLPREVLRPTWMQDVQAVRLEQDRLAREAEARRLEQDRLEREAAAAAAAAAARLAQEEAEARRLEQDRLEREAAAVRLAQEEEARIKAEKARIEAAKARREAEEKARRKSEFQKVQNAKTLKASTQHSTTSTTSKHLSGVAKPQTTTKPSEVAKITHVAHKSTVPTQASEQPQEPVAVPTVRTSWLSRLDPRSWNPRSWSLSMPSMPSWLRRKKEGGTRKHKNRNNQHNATKRRHK